MIPFTEEDFEKRYRKFDSLDPTANGHDRKQLIRELERDIRASEGTWLGAGQVEPRIAGNSEIDRIHVYLLAEQARVGGAAGDLRRHVESEWDRLARASFSPNRSRQPLHYSLRAYAAKLLAIEPGNRPVGDVPFFDGIVARLAKTDAGSGVYEKALEVRKLLPEIKAAGVETASQVRVARLAMIGAIIAAIIGVIGTWGTEIIKVVFG
jgi:hypothetical protein